MTVGNPKYEGQECNPTACHLVNPVWADHAKQLGMNTIWLYERPKSCRKLDETPEQQGQCTCCSLCCTCGG